MSAYIPTLYDNVTLALLPFGAEVLFCCLNEIRHSLIISIIMHYNRSTTRLCSVIAELGKNYRHII